MKTPEQIIQSVFARWKSDITPAWEDGTYTPNEDQFAEMAVEAIETDRAQRSDMDEHIGRAERNLHTVM